MSDTWREVAAWFAFSGWFSFTVLYGLLTRWWTSPEGRNAMAVSAALGWTIGIIVAAYTWPDYDFRPWLVPLSLFVLGLLGFHRTWQMFVRRHQRRKRES